MQFSTNLCIPNGDLIFEVDESIHFEKHKFIINLNPFQLSYALNDVDMCVINSLNLLSIERIRNNNEFYDTDTTAFAPKDSDMFYEKEWKGITE